MKAKLKKVIEEEVDNHIKHSKLTELPKQWCFTIKQDKANPLWKIYISWMNKEYNINWNGNSNGYYGCNGPGGAYFSYTVDHNATVITLEQWNEAVNGFPEKWYIRTTKESVETICDWFDYLSEDDDTDRTVGNYFTYSGQGWMHYAYPEYTEGLTEITFEQFKKYVLKEEELLLPSKFVLPKQWCFKITKKNYQEFKHLRMLVSLQGYITSKPYDNLSWGWWEDTIYGKEITFEEFKEHVLKEKPMKEKYTLEELSETNKVIVYIDNKKDWQRIKDTGKGFKTMSDFKGRHCYSLLSNTFSSDSTRTNPGAYGKNVKIIEVNQIIFEDMKKIIRYQLKKEYEQFRKAAEAIAQYQTPCSNPLEYYITIHGEFYKRLVNAGVFELWFEPIYEEEFKKGDWVTVLDTPNVEKYNSRAVGHIFPIRKDGDYYTRFMEGNGSPIDPQNTYSVNYIITDVRKATPEEILKASIPDIEIREYKAEFTENTVKFGCQTYSKSFVLDLDEFLSRSGLQIQSQDEISKIADYFRRNIKP